MRGDLLLEKPRLRQAFTASLVELPAGPRYLASRSCHVQVTHWEMKAVVLSHYALVANVLLTIAGTRTNDDLIEMSLRLYRPGEVTIGGEYLVTHNG